MTLLLVAWLFSAGPVRPDVPVTLEGSPESMQRQHAVAREGGYRFFATPASVRAAVRAGDLVPLRGDQGYTPKERDSVVRPELRSFVERFGAAFRAACGERLVVTSATRARTRQPHNAHPLSVHPAGLALDLRVPRARRCRRWLEDSLLSLERQGVLDATRERNPPHYHVALFPSAYLAMLERNRTPGPRVIPTSAEPTPPPIRSTRRTR